QQGRADAATTTTSGPERPSQHAGADCDFVRRSMTVAEVGRTHFEGEIGARISPRSNWRAAIEQTDEVIGFVTPRPQPLQPGDRLPRRHA
ncbi:MAG: hypothetical protein WBG57_09485, partial [Ornithinimicrobium sp.]